MRATIPQPREVLQSRVTMEQHEVRVAQLLVHIDTLDTELQYLSERMELALATHAQIVELLSTLPASKTRPSRT